MAQGPRAIFLFLANTQFYNRFVELEELTEFIVQPTLHHAIIWNVNRPVIGHAGVCLRLWAKRDLDSVYGTPRITRRRSRGVWFRLRFLLRSLGRLSVARMTNGSVGDASPSSMRGSSMTWESCFGRYVDRSNGLETSVGKPPGNRWAVSGRLDRASTGAAEDAAQSSSTLERLNRHRAARESIPIPDHSHGYCTDEQCASIDFDSFSVGRGRQGTRRRCIRSRRVTRVFESRVQPRDGTVFRKLHEFSDSLLVKKDGSEIHRSASLWALGTCKSAGPPSRF